MNKYLQRLNIAELKPMQVEAIEKIKTGKDVIILSPTGSGKTLAFLIPLTEMLSSTASNVQALILTPTRELTLQIEKVFKAMQTGHKVNVGYGGHPMKTELNSLSVPPVLLIGTPGRIADHIRRRSFEVNSVSILVLDEFDKSLELGFKEEMSFIVSSLTKVNTRILTSATAAVEIPPFIELQNPIRIDYTSGQENKLLKKYWLRTEGNDKLELLFNLFCNLGDEASVVFCNHREAVERISHLLKEKDISHGVFHGGMEQEKREMSLIKFRNGTHHILLTTDLASRGLDIPEIRNVIHYQLPGTATVWTHRNGRTARMGEGGKVWLLLTENDYIPEYIEEEISEGFIAANTELPPASFWETLYISLGKKDKVSKGDIAGFLMQVGNLKKEEIGKIEVLDYTSFVAIKKDKALKTLMTVRGLPLKRKAIKIEIARD